MNLIEIAKLRPKNTVISFRGGGEMFMIDHLGSFLDATGKLVKLTDSFLLRDYELICDHKKQSMSLIDQKYVQWICVLCRAPMLPETFRVAAPGEFTALELNASIDNYPGNPNMSDVIVYHKTL